MDCSTASHIPTVHNNVYSSDDCYLGTYCACMESALMGARCEGLPW